MKNLEITLKQYSKILLTTHNAKLFEWLQEDNVRVIFNEILEISEDIDYLKHYDDIIDWLSSLLINNVYIENNKLFIKYKKSELKKLRNK